jgi:hypothetical protein
MVTKADSIRLTHIKRKAGFYGFYPQKYIYSQRARAKGVKKAKLDKGFYLERYRQLNTLYTEYDIARLTNEIANALNIEMSEYTPDIECLYLYDNEPICAYPLESLTDWGCRNC